MDSIAVSYALLDPLMTLVRPLAALVTAVLAGFVENIVNWREPGAPTDEEKDSPAGTCGNGGDFPEEEQGNHDSPVKKLVAGIRYATTDVWGDIALWFFVGVLAAAVITVIIPDEWMVSVLGGGPMSMGIMLLVGIPLYICATASTPVAAALILKGVSPGAALVFLLVGPATNVTSLSVLFKLLGRKSTVRYLIILAISAVLFGLGLDSLYRLLGLSPRATIGGAAELIPEPAQVGAALLLLLLSIRPLVARCKNHFLKRRQQTQFISSFPIAGSGQADFRQSQPTKGTVHSDRPGGTAAPPRKTKKESDYQ